MTLGLGLAFSTKAITIRAVAVVEKSTSKNILKDYLQKNTIELNSYEEKIKKFEHTIETHAYGKNKMIFYMTSEEQATLLLKRGLVVVVASEDGDGISYELDPRNQEAQITYFMARSMIENSFVEYAMEKVSPIEIPGTRYVDFLIPGMVGMGVMMSCMWGISYGLIERRSKKLLRRLLATPMKKSYYLFSQIFTRTIMGFIESSILIIFSFYFFKLQIGGSFFTLLLVFFAGHWAFSGLAIFTASRTTSIDLGTGIINIITTPMVVLSGVFFSSQNFPEWSQPIIRNLPLTLLINTLRKVMLEGMDIMLVGEELLILTVFGTICFILGLKIFKWY